MLHTPMPLPKIFQDEVRLEKKSAPHITSCTYRDAGHHVMSAACRRVPPYSPQLVDCTAHALRPRQQPHKQHAQCGGGDVSCGTSRALVKEGDPGDGSKEQGRKEGKSLSNRQQEAQPLQAYPGWASAPGGTCQAPVHTSLCSAW